MKCRVAVTQFGIGNDVAENLKTCLRMIDEAAKVSPDFIVLPEFCNHCAVYENQEHADAVALGLDGEFLQKIAEKAREHKAYVKINVTLKKPNDKPSVSNLLYSPDGKLVGRADKQVLMGNENAHCSRAETAGDVVETEFGKVGMYACADGLLMETTRLLALRGARLLLNSLNSFAEDEAALHIPVRAAENKVFVAASCKVDYLVPLQILKQFAERMKIRPEALQGAGESQIVAPDGTVLAKARRTGEDVVFADIDLSEAKPEIMLENRRPGLYRPIAEKPQERNYKPGARTVKVAVCQQVRDISKVNAKLIVLPELVEECEKIIKHLTDNFAVTSIRENNSHVGILLGKDGIIFRQKQIHKSNRHGWITDFGDELETFDLPFGRLAIVVGEDSRYPETFRLAAYQNAEIVAVPFQVTERWETELGFLERSAENRFSVIAATRPEKNLGEYGESLIATISEDFTLWTEWKNRPFDGKINYPIVFRGNEIVAEAFPSNSANRFVSKGTDVVDGRAWHLLGELTEKI
jgi:predicted amidohydrolase